MTSCRVRQDRHDCWVDGREEWREGLGRRKVRVHRMVDRVGDNHQIFPEDGHRLAAGDHAVNAYSVNSFTWDAPQRQGDARLSKEFDRGLETP